MSQDAKSKKQPQIWGTGARITIFLFFLITSLGMVYAWYNTPAINRAMLTTHFDDSLENGLENFARWGDSYGAMNALFSGIAMVAAMTAIGFQVVELGGQRHEIRLQLKEMETANSTNIERLEFDKQVFEFERLKRAVALFDRFSREPVMAQYQTLRGLKEQVPVPLEEYFLFWLSDDHKERLAEKWNHQELQLILEWGSPVHNQLNHIVFLIAELGICGATKAELSVFGGNLALVKEPLEAMVSAARLANQQTEPTWLYGIRKVIEAMK